MKYYHRYQVAPSDCGYPPPPSQTVTGTPVLTGCRDVQLGLTDIGHVISLLGLRPKQFLTQNRSRSARQNKFKLGNSRPFLVAYCALRTAPVPTASLSDASLIPSPSLGVTLCVIVYRYLRPGTPTRYCKPLPYREAHCRPVAVVDITSSVEKIYPVLKGA